MTGVEPASDWLEANCNTVIPHPHVYVLFGVVENVQNHSPEQAAGVEPTPEGLEHLCTIHCATLAFWLFFDAPLNEGVDFRRAQPQGILCWSRTNI